MNEKTNEFVLCINNEDCDDMEVRKVYQVITDEGAEKEGYVRVIDESGEDYLYPANYFCHVDLAANVRESLLHAA